MPIESTTRADAGLPRAPLGVLVVDDQLVVREGVARLISCAAVPMRCIGTAATGTEALRAAEELHPEIVVLDVDLAGEDGLALIPRLMSSRARVLVLTSHGDAATRARARLLGASGFVEKHQPAADLLGSIVELSLPQVRGETTPGAEGPRSHHDVAASSAAPSRPHP
jgi:DNA-binding NarL/FixJ family response regulator